MKRTIVYLAMALMPTLGIAQNKGVKPVNNKTNKAAGKVGEGVSATSVRGNASNSAKPNNNVSLNTSGGKGNGSISTTETGSKSPGINVNNGGKAVEPQNVNWKEVSGAAQPVIQEKPNGSINWTEQYIEAKGESAIDLQKFPNAAQAKLMAKRGAIVVAQRNLLEIIKGVNVTGETTVEDMITTKDYIYTRVDGVVKGAVQVGEAIENDGIITVRLRVPLYDRNGLAPAIYNDLASFEKKGNINVNANPNAANGTGTTTGRDNSGTLSSNPNDFNPFVFNLNGQKYDPSMFPLVTDESGNILVDMSKVYDPSKGNFPQILNIGKDLTDAFGWQQGSQIIDAVAQPGKIVIPNSQKSKVNWGKVANTIADIGRFVIRMF
jgi:hypothetical protein